MATKVRAAFPLKGQVEGESKMSDNVRTGCVACANVRILPRGSAGSTDPAYSRTTKDCNSWTKLSNLLHLICIAFTNEESSEILRFRSALSTEY